MAPENAESQPASFALSDSGEPTPDSAPLRVSSATQLESGIPPARERRDTEHSALRRVDLDLNLEDGVRRIEAALGNAVRTEANLGLLLRGLKHVAANAEAARTANTELLHELDELSAQLTRSQSEEHALRLRVTQLEQLVALIRRETTSERAFLLEEQDRFLREVLDDHERQLNELRKRVRAPEGKSESEKIAELTAQRDQAREYATRCERERDLAWEELATGIAPPTERMQRSPSGAAQIGAIALRSVSATGTAARTAEEAMAARSATGYSMSGEDVSEE